MKKLFLLLTLVGMIFTACESGGSVEEENGGNTPTLKIELSKQTVDVDFEVGSYSISVTSPYSWDAVSKNDWIIVNSKTGIAGTEELLFSVERNFEEKERKGTILITNSIYNLATELYVVQNAFEPEISIGAETLNFPVEGGRKEVAITANFEYEVSTSASWVTCSKNQKGITVSVPNYKEVDERRAEITIANKNYNISKTIKVAQGAFVPEITMDTEIVEFAAKSGAKDVAITANFEYEVSTSASWVTYSKKQNGITVSVPNYGKIEERTANITISSGMYNISKTIKIRQKGLTEEEYAEQILVYTSSDGMVINPKDAFCFDANIVSNTYKNGQGVILFDAPITCIGKSAFYHCSSLTSVTIPDSVTSIGEYAFSECTSLTSVTIPNSVTSIGDYAFQSCTSLTSVTIPNSVTSIGYWAFRGCTSLTSATIPDSVTSIGDGVFSYCTSLTSVTLPDSVTSIGNSAFYNCNSLTSVTIPNSVTSIGSYAFYECTSLTSVTIPNSVTSIGNEAFYWCTSLTSITIPDSVTSIGERAFKSCTSLTSVTIGKGVTSIGYCAFYNCNSLTSVTIPDGVTSIGAAAFSSCASLTSFYGKFSSEDKCCLIVDSTLVAFAPACGKTSYIIPDSVTSIGKYAFRGCTSLTSVTIGNGVTSIGTFAFSGCTSLTNVTIPDSVTSIAQEAFYYCTSLTSVTIGKGVTKIGYSAFSSCTSLKEVYCKPIIPPSGDSSMFSQNASGRKIYVPRASVNAYKLEWSDYSSSIVGYDF